MKIKEGFVLRKIGEEVVVVPVATGQLNFNGMINLNETGAFLWEKLSRECTREELVRTFAEEYDIGLEKAQEDVADFVKRLDEAGFIL